MNAPAGAHDSNDDSDSAWLRSFDTERQLDLLELACSTARMGIFERDLRTGASHWNRALFEIRGLEGTGHAPPFETAALGVIESDRAHFDAAMRGSLLPRHGSVRQQNFRMHYRARAPDDTVRYLHKQWTVRYGENGHAEVMRGVVLDETPFRSLQLAHEQATTQLSLAAEFAGIAVWHQDVDTGMVSFNSQAAELFGLEQQLGTIPQARLRMSLHPADRAAADAADTAAISSRGPVDAELRYRTRSGDWRHLFTRRGTRTDAPGGSLTLVGIALDMGVKLAPSTEPPLGSSLIASSAGRNRFLAQLSHELRTPMNAVLGFARLLSHQEDGAASLPPARRRALSLITMSGQHMMALIRDVQDLSRLESGELPVSLEPVALDEAASSALSMLEIARQERRIDVHLRGLERLVLADATRLRQVLLNLLSNAIKYGRTEGSVSLRAELQSDGVHLTVEDDGPGMSAEQLLHIFEPFNRLGSESSAIEGTGLGLSISKMLIERMGGRVSVSSQPGHGTVIELVLLPA